MTNATEVRVRLCLTDLGADWAVLSDADAVRNDSDYSILFQTGPSSFTGGLAQAVWAGGGWAVQMSKPRPQSRARRWTSVPDASPLVLANLVLMVESGSC